MYSKLIPSTDIYFSFHVKEIFRSNVYFILYSNFKIENFPEHTVLSTLLSHKKGTSCSPKEASLNLKTLYRHGIAHLAGIIRKPPDEI